MFWERFYNLCIDHGTKPNAVVKQLGFSSAVCTQWKQRKTTPKVEFLRKIADYFGVSVDYLSGNSPYKMPETPSAEPNAAYKMPDSAVKLGLDNSKPLKTQSSKMPDFIKRVGDLSEDELDELNTFLDFIKTRKAKKAAPQDG